LIEVLEQAAVIAADDGRTEITADDVEAAFEEQTQ
jgi:histone H3/H4